MQKRWSDNKPQPIYIQIALQLSEPILMEVWQTGFRLLAIRITADQFGVAVNTMARAYGFLEEKKVIYKKRGVGFFVAEGGRAKIKDYQKNMFFTYDLPEFFKNIILFDISFDELFLKYPEFRVNSYQEKRQVL